METQGDILQEIPNEDLEKLKDLYKEHQKWAPHVYSLFDTCIRWKKTEPDKNYLTFYTIGDDYLKTGTFVLLMQYNCYDIFVFTLEKSPENLRKAISETKRIDWTKYVFFYASLRRFTRTICEVLESRNIRYFADESGLFRITKETALKFEIVLPVDVYLGKITEGYVKEMNEVWPHKYKGSESYLSVLVRLNGGFGIFLRENDELVAWVLKSVLGQLGVLQTKDGFKRRGYASILIKALARDIAAEDHDVIGTVVKGNTASETLFTKLGFENIDACFYIHGNI